MDIPEQPTVWPPAPSIAPPEQEKAKSFKLTLPDWAKYWFSYRWFFIGTGWVIEMFCDVDHVPCPR